MERRPPLHFGLEAGSKAELLTPCAASTTRGLADLLRLQDSATFERRSWPAGSAASRWVIEPGRRSEPIIGRQPASAHALDRVRTRAAARPLAVRGLSGPSLISRATTAPPPCAADLWRNAPAALTSSGQPDQRQSPCSRRPVREAGQIYVQAAQLGAPLGFLDVGGGLRHRLRRQRKPPPPPPPNSRWTTPTMWWHRCASAASPQPASPAPPW